MTLKQGDILSVKTTGEYVYFTGNQNSDGTWVVHRPVLTREGIRHEYDSFEANELETPAEHIRREVDEALLKLQAQKDVMDAKMKALQAQQEAAEAVEPETKVDYTLN